MEPPLRRRVRRVRGQQNSHRRSGLLRLLRGREARAPPRPTCPRFRQAAPRTRPGSMPPSLSRFDPLPPDRPASACRSIRRRSRARLECFTNAQQQQNGEQRVPADVEEVVARRDRSALQQSAQMPASFASISVIPATAVRTAMRSFAQLGRESLQASTTRAQSCRNPLCEVALCSDPCVRGRAVYRWHGRRLPLQLRGFGSGQAQAFRLDRIEKLFCR